MIICELYVFQYHFNLHLAIYLFVKTHGSVVCYKPAGCGCDSRWGYSIILVDINPSSRTMALGLTQPLTEMSTRNIPGGNGRPARKADNLTAICEPII
jgi:hypothetical protein